MTRICSATGAPLYINSWCTPSTLGKTKVKGWMKKNVDTEREQQERALAVLTEQADTLSMEVKAAETKYHRAETRVGARRVDGICVGVNKGEGGIQWFRDKHASFVCVRLYHAKGLKYFSVKLFSLVRRGYHQNIISDVFIRFVRSEHVLAPH